MKAILRPGPTLRGPTLHLPVHPAYETVTSGRWPGVGADMYLDVKISTGTTAPRRPGGRGHGRIGPWRRNGDS